MVVCAELIQTLEIHVPKNLQPTRMGGHHFFGNSGNFPHFINHVEIMTKLGEVA